MTSNTSAGERRWTSRRSGMTVLGKVAVPKPINLPSQRLENHGLNPNVEIVPKGTLGWGTRSSSHTSNAWGSSSLSPRADSCTGSPSHLSGRPSSSGGGSRPSTAGSDKFHEHVGNAWGSSSRPASASGVLTSNQTALASSRPRSAETRPGSSQLSRFAESLSENSVARGPSETVEKLSISSSKKDGFSLTSVDFPTLGSDKDSTEKDKVSQDHGFPDQPNSSSGQAGGPRERTGTSLTNIANTNANANVTSEFWRSENFSHGENGARPTPDKWHADLRPPQPYPNANLPPQHYETWHGPPINNYPREAWYRGPPGGPPYGPPVGPGGFPMEPFPYYRPHIPPNAQANSSAVSLTGAGQRGHSNIDAYRPAMPDACIPPVMPIRPGYRPGPVAYEDYHGPPMSYSNNNEQDMPLMGMPYAPPAYNRYPGQRAAGSGYSHERPSGYNQMSRQLAPQRVESCHPNEAPGPYKVLLKQHDDWGRIDGEKWECESVKKATTNDDTEDQHRPSSRDNDWNADREKAQVMNTRKNVHGIEASSHSFDRRGADHYSVHDKSNSPEGVRNSKASDSVSIKKIEHAVSCVSNSSGTSKDSSLIQKIEGLNAKARASDGEHEIVSVSGVEQKNKPRASKSFHPVDEAPTGVVHPQRSQVGGSFNHSAREVEHSTGAIAVSRSTSHGIQGRADHNGKERFNSQELDGRPKKPNVVDASDKTSAPNYGHVQILRVQDYATTAEVEKSSLYRQGWNERETVGPALNLNDSQAQRAVMRDLAQQRIKQRQKEEEERIRDQKAKALAKLEELNRRTQAAEHPSERTEAASSSTSHNKLEESETLQNVTLSSSSAIISNRNELSQNSDNGAEVQKSSSLLNEPSRETPITIEETTALDSRVSNAHIDQVGVGPRVLRDHASKQKHLGFKQKKNALLQKNLNEMSSTSSTIKTAEDPTNQVGVACGVVSSSESNLTVSSNFISESSAHQRRKNTRGGKTKQKVDASSLTALSSVDSKDKSLVNTSAEGGSANVSESKSDPIGLVQSPTDLSDTKQSADMHRRMSTQLKSHNSRWTQRNTQANKSVDKLHAGDVIWAPVQTHMKKDGSGEFSQKNVVEDVLPSTKMDQQLQTNSKNKRAEIERYVAKPIAKEMAQQGGIQQQAAQQNNQAILDDAVQEPLCVTRGAESLQSAGAKLGSASESKNGNGRQNRYGKEHGAWRQRVSAETSHSKDGLSPNPRSVQISTESSHLKEDGSYVKQPKYSEGWSVSSTSVECSDSITDTSDFTALLTAPVLKDQGVSGRPKRNAHKGNRSTRNKHDDHKRPTSGDVFEVSGQSSGPELSHIDIPPTSNEYCNVGDRVASHWQPKSKTPAVSNLRENRSGNGRNVTESAKTNKKDYASLSQAHKPTNVDYEKISHVQLLSDKSNVEESIDTRQQEPKRERKAAPHKGEPHVRNEGPGGTALKAGNRDRHFAGGQESCGDWDSIEQDNNQVNSTRNKDRPRRSSHYEYQPIGPHNNEKPNNFPQGKDGSRPNQGPRFKERVPSHLRRGGGGGNSYGRQSDNV